MSAARKQIRGQVLTSAGRSGAEILVDGDRIIRVGDAPDAPDLLVLPGLVDLHCHGGGGASFTAGDPEQVAVAAAHHHAHGTTTLLGSAVSDSPARMLDVVATLADAVESGLLAGIHLEGPFLAAAQCGAQDPASLCDPDLGLAAELLDAGRGHVRVMTMAPELPGAEELAGLLHERGVMAAAGHTGADTGRIEQFLRGSGNDLVTHLFNGMAPFHHRSPGAVGGALSAAAEGTARLELIADGVHLADETVAILLGLLGPGRVLFVSDAMAAAGMPDGDYALGPQRVRVASGVARLENGGSIAGGTTRLIDQVRRHVGRGLAPSTVVAAASSVPAQAAGLSDVGTIQPGKRADLVVTDYSFTVQRVMRAGAWMSG